MTTQLYRIRSTEHLLGKHQELLEQQIYFARPDELNDPMEGYREIVWKGDDIVWINLFRNYISCLNLTVALATLNGDTRVVAPEELPIEGLENRSSSPIVTTVLDDLCAVVFDRCRLYPLITRLSTADHAVRRDELLLYLRSIHYVALEEINKAHRYHGGSPSNETGKSTLNLSECVSIDPTIIRQIYRDNPDLAPSKVGSLFSEFNRQNDNINLVMKYQIGRQNAENGSNLQSNRDLIVFDFPSTYVSQLTRILYPSWYVACLLEDYHNSSVWGHYGSNHTGTCLIFDVNDVSGNPGILLNHIVGFSGRKDSTSGRISSEYQWRYSPIRFYRIKYEEKMQDLDFFRSIGALPTGKLLSDWYTDRSGQRSRCCDHIEAKNEQAWRENYWENFIRDITIKSRDWSYEREYRLILTSSIVDLSQPSTRQLTYKFESLRGVIFGMKMSDSDKMRIIQIILEKCRQYSRNSFEFYQAYYCQESNSIEKQKLDIEIPMG